MLHTICQQFWKTQQWPQDWKRSVFNPIPKKGNPKERSNYRTIALISHTSKVMFKILQARLQQYVNNELPDVKAGIRKEEPEIKLPTSTGSLKKQESSRKTSTALLTTPKPLSVWITTNWKILPEMGIPDHLTWLLRNLYAGQVATVRTGQETKDWFKIGKGVRLLSPCLFNLYVDYIMRNAGLDEACREKYQELQICRWHHSYVRKRRSTKETLDESERGEWKNWLKTQHSEN